MLCLFAYDFCLSCFPAQSAAKSARRQCGPPCRVPANAGASVQSGPRISGRNRIPEKYRRVFEQIPFFTINFRSGQSLRPVLTAEKSRSGAQHFPAPLAQTAARRGHTRTFGRRALPFRGGAARPSAPAGQKMPAREKTNAFFDEHS